ncbi:NAD(P)-dependent alcohol dehydrogenase [Paraburkholderia sp. MM5384-R2]|uniref:zinc-dependent alcohol dehydrogenase family protein n=1 Tax=Paraburkholderia sp. MM5384-R2 TaxID=2723097 RepID=UPI001622359A|nr:NAD(P)-dependent alcohol dehydrogenase [Paraburkholderia sp. MM5384-R2]MBB5499362.1 NADPH:quinone reductase-like Zn-dependent oxidoreductase [Paraburkholderia sp. MM5384-R2]
MKIWEINEKFGIENLKLNDAEEPRPGPGQVKLRMLAASLNYRDLVIVQGEYGKVIKPPVVPVSDGMGEVVEVGEGVTKFKVGDRLCPIFFPDWLEGEATGGTLRQDRALGSSRNGMLCEFAVVAQERAVQVPDYLSDVEAATLPCAGVTAWNALMHGRPIMPKETVLIQGTGGVSVIALQLAKAMGANAIVISSSDEKLERAKKLGADATVNYRQFEDWHKEVVKICAGGVDRVIEVGGAETLPKSLKAVRAGGTISLVGILSGGKAAIELALVVMRFIRLDGITVGSRSDFESMLRTMNHVKLRPEVGLTVPFREVPAAFEKVREGGTFGKICVSY